MSIAYQVLGDGPLDLVFVPGFVSHIEIAWDEPYLPHGFAHHLWRERREPGLGPSSDQFERHA